MNLEFYFNAIKPHNLLIIEIHTFYWNANLH